MASGDQYVLCMAFSPEKTDGKWLMTISANNDHNLRLWDWKTKELLGHGQVRKTPLFAPFIYKNEHFAKTGSGQT
jgi:WD40 repeat protein